VFNQEREEFAIPRGNQVINEGDEVFLVSTAEDIKEAADFLTA
jgi:Trk K+ transport system NAD-binding subunit